MSDVQKVMTHPPIMLLWMTLAMIAPASGHGMTAAEAAEHESPASSQAESVRVQTHDFSFRVPWFGRVESNHSIDLIARAPGRIIAVKVADEAPVQSGAELFELGGAEVTARQTDLTKQVEVATDAVRAARQNLVIRKQLLSQKLSSRELLNAAKQALASAEGQLSTAKQALTTFDAAIHIRTAVDGIFTGRNVHIGQYVTPGTVLGRIVNPRTVRIRASLFPPSEMILPGLKAIVRTDMREEKQAIVSRIMPERTPEGAAQVWIEGDALKGLAPGMQVSGVILREHPALAVPERAIAMDDRGQAYAFVKTAQGWHKQRIKTGLHDHDWVEIVTGLKESEQVAVENTYEMLYRDFSKMYRAPD